MIQCVTAGSHCLGDMIRGSEHQFRLGQVQVTKTRLCPQGTQCTEQAKLDRGAGGVRGGQAFPTGSYGRGEKEGINLVLGHCLVWFDALLLYWPLSSP